MLLIMAKRSVPIWIRQNMGKNDTRRFLSALGAMLIDWTNNTLFGENLRLLGVEIHGVPAIIGNGLDVIGAADWFSSLVHGLGRPHHGRIFRRVTLGTVSHMTYSLLKRRPKNERPNAGYSGGATHPRSVRG